MTHEHGEPAPLDGNGLGGVLGAFLGVDVTDAILVCDGCGRQQVLAALVVFGAGPGGVARCRGCSHVMLRVAEIRDELVVDLRGTTRLRLRRP